MMRPMEEKHDARMKMKHDEELHRLQVEKE